jgi:hypothetical protein
MSKEAPKVFISYSHDDPDHKKWVANLGIRLRQNGVDAILDQWDLFPGEDIPVFMERNLSESMFAILVCTKRYVEKANSGKGGVGYEKMIVTSELVKNMEASKFIPIIRQRGTHEVPKFIQTKLFIDFSNDEDFEAVFDELLRTIFRSSVGKKLPLGTAPTFNEGQEITKKNDSDLQGKTLEVFKEMAQQYESGDKSYWNKRDVGRFSTGRIATEHAFSILEAKGYLVRDRDGDFVISAKGRNEILRLDLV